MEEIIFSVQGSNPEPYEVIFTKHKGQLFAECDCPAGGFSSICKHRINILSGDIKAVVSDNLDELPTVQSWLVGTQLEKALLELKEAEKASDTAKKRLTKAKKKLARLMILEEED